VYGIEDAYLKVFFDCSALKDDLYRRIKIDDLAAVLITIFLSGESSSSSRGAARRSGPRGERTSAGAA
jgi:hypothetical protein